MQYVKQRRPQSVTASNRPVLPIPHPLDYDWRFSDVAIQHSLTGALNSHSRGYHSIIRSPSVLRAAIERDFPREWVLLDVNATVIESLTTAAPEARILSCDVTNDPLPE